MHGTSPWDGEIPPPGQRKSATRSSVAGEASKLDRSKSTRTCVLAVMRVVARLSGGGFELESLPDEDVHLLCPDVVFWNYVPIPLHENDADVPSSQRTISLLDRRRNAAVTWTYANFVVTFRSSYLRPLYFHDDAPAAERSCQPSDICPITIVTLQWLTPSPVVPAYNEHDATLNSAYNSFPGSGTGTGKSDIDTLSPCSPSSCNKNVAKL